MKKFKSLTVLFFLFAFTMGGFQSCSIYPENEEFTIVSKAERVANVWKIDNYKVNDVDYTSLVTSYTETFTKDGNYSYQWGILGGTGTWKFQKNYSEILLTGVNNQSDRTLVILKLEENQFWYYYMDGSDKKVYHLVN
jgi:hypothetical protein